MSCLIRVKIPVNKIERSGGSNVVTTILEKTDVLQLQAMMVSGKDIIIEPFEDAHSYFDEYHHFLPAFLNSFVGEDNKLLFKKILSFGNDIVDRYGDTVSHQLLMQGYSLSLSEIIALNNPSNDRIGNTLSHYAAVYAGKRFSVKELKKIANPSNSNGFTVMHPVAFAKGHYSVNELLEMNNPKDNYGCSVAHVMAIYTPNVFSISDILRLGNPVDDEGNTIAHVMISKGKSQQFTEEEIEQLGNPVNGRGEFLIPR